MCKIFKQNYLNITIEANKRKIIDFLDMTLDLRTGINRPYRKPNSSINYLQTDSKHPPSIMNYFPVSLLLSLINLIRQRSIITVSPQTSGVLTFLPTIAAGNCSDRDQNEIKSPTLYVNNFYQNRHSLHVSTHVHLKLMRSSREARADSFSFA